MGAVEHSACVLDPEVSDSHREAPDRIARGENQSTEFKEAFPESAVDLAKEIAAFATSNEGWIYLGVRDDGAIAGLTEPKGLTESEQRDAVQKRIQGVAEIVTPRVRVSVDFLESMGGKTCEIYVPKGTEPVYYVNNIPYLRDLSVSRRASPEEVKELHFRYFLARGMPAGTERQEAYLALLNQLSDLRLILSDVKERIGEDLRQWRYDLQATAQVLRQ